MKQARYYFLPDRAKPHKVGFYDNDGKRHFKFFADKSAALLFLAECNATAKLPPEITFSVAERLVFAQIKSLCSEVGVSLEKALDVLKLKLADSVSHGKDWDEAVAEFLADAERRGCRALTLGNYRQRLALFAHREAVKNIAEITEERAESYLSGILSPEHAKRVLRAFFNFCKAKKWVAVNPFESAKLPRRLDEKELPHVLSVADVQKIMLGVPEVWRPLFALLAFCGVRPNELVSPDKLGLRIFAVDFKTRKISIPADVAKTRSARIFSPPQNVWKWLAPLKARQSDDFIAPASYEVFRRVKAQCGVNIPHDALRHSFASYGFHALGAERTVETLGHVGGFAVFAKHYKGLATPQDARRYFEIVP